MTATENPAIPRFQWILGRYPPVVVYHALLIWLAAVGSDDTVRSIRHWYSARDRRPKDDATMRAWLEQDVLAMTHYANDMPEGAPAGLIQAVAEGHPGPFAPEATVYDRYIPWLAEFLNRRLTRVEALLNRHQVRLPPGWVVGIDPLMGDPPAPITRHHEDPAIWPVVDSVHQFNETRAALANEFRSLADYARAKRLSLSSITTPDELGDALAAARDWERGREIKRVVEGTVLATFPDGWTVQELTTPEQLKWEGERMHHCVFDYADLSDKATRYYSLRDPDGRPQVTVEHHTAPEDDSYVQIKGVANSRPSDALVRRVTAFRMDERPAGTWTDVDPDLYADWLPGFQQAWEDDGGETWVLVATTARGGRWSWDLIPGSIIDEELVAPAEASADRSARRGTTEWQRAYERMLGERVYRLLPIVGELHADASRGGHERSSVAWLLWNAGYGVPYDSRSGPGQAMVADYAEASDDELAQLLVGYEIWHPDHIEPWILE